MYWRMGLHSIHPEYKNVRYLGIFNPRLNTVYRYEVNRLPEETIEFMDYDIIVYRRKSDSTGTVSHRSSGL